MYAPPGLGGAARRWLRAVLLLLPALRAGVAAADGSPAAAGTAEGSHHLADTEWGRADGEARRRLPDITGDLSDNTTELLLSPPSNIGSPLQLRPNNPLVYGSLQAGLRINLVQVTDFGDGNIFRPTNPYFRVIRGVADTAVDPPEFRVDDRLTGFCLDDDYVRRSADVNDPWAAEGAVGNPSTPPDNILMITTPLTFKMGGFFKICYSDDGSFAEGHADEVPPLITISGAYDDRPECAMTDSCLMTRIYNCYVLRESFNNMGGAYGPTSCVVTWQKVLPPAPQLEKGTWSREFGANYDEASGTELTITPRTCANEAEAPANFLCNVDDCDEGEPFITPVGSRMHLPPARSDLLNNFFKASTVAACYCPDFGGCNQYKDFLQQVGILHYYASKVLPNRGDAWTSAVDFNGATPRHRFSVRVECPPGACSTSSNSKVKIVAQSAENDLPSWEASNGCFEAVHGRSQDGKIVFPEHSNIMDVATVDGGPRQDYKIWNCHMSQTGLYDNCDNTSGFLFEIGTSSFEVRNRYEGETFDVCFCKDACANRTSWFKVGQIRFASFQLVSALTNTSRMQDQFIIEYMNQPGILGFHRDRPDYGLLGLQETGRVKLVNDSTLSLDDLGCAEAPYDDRLVEPTNGLTETTALTLYSARTNATFDDKKLVFNDGDPSNLITVTKAGLIAVCYCAGDCATQNWVLAARLTIRGPGPGQSWVFSTHVIFRFEYTGWGLTSEDKVRIIADGECSDDNGNPRAASESTDIRLQCPDPCSEVGEVTQRFNGDISVKVVADDAYLCDERNTNCQKNDIKAVTVLDEHTTELEFEAPPLLDDGDRIILGENVVCDRNCNEEQLSTLKGRFLLADRRSNDAEAPDEYITGHAISTTSNPNAITIPVGWPANGPTFDVAVNAAEAKRGRWSRQNRASTAQEIKGTRSHEDMKVCWKYGRGPEKKYIAQVGTLTLVQPNPMAECVISLTTTVKPQRDPYAPFVLSFRTAGQATGERYRTVQGSTVLRIIFYRTNAIDITFTDGGAIENNIGEDEVIEAKQYICGKLFKELWSSNTDLGFPMPRGCFYRVYGPGDKREVALNMIFDPKNGLSEDTDYQMVMTGFALDAAQAGEEYVEIFTMDDMDTKPYEAIERGLAVMGQTPQDPAFGSDGVRFLEPDGVKIIGGEGADTVSLRGGVPLQMELKGEPLGGGIKQSSVLRIFLWPLTQWNVANRCTVTCIAHDEDVAPCGAVQDCKGEAVVRNFHQNILKVVMPASMATMNNEISHTLRFQDLVLPTAGFFPTAIAAQISTHEDLKPHYIESLGDLLLKIPDGGQTVAKLVDVYGDGNDRPFRGDTLNVLYANIILAATLYAEVQTGDALLNLTLPVGYECVAPPLVTDGRTPWGVEETLGVFAGTIPQGTGAPDEGGSGTRGWTVRDNTCIYTLRQNAVIYAGSSLYIRVTVNNPQRALKRDDTDNRWFVTLRSKGSARLFVDFPVEVFKTTGGNYSDNRAVLGHMTDAVITPSNFAVSNNVGYSRGTLMVFFRTEQATTVHASVQLLAPHGFSFSPCEAGNLDIAYYMTHTGPPTKPLPGILSPCDHNLEPFNHAHVGLMGALRAETMYGFQIAVQNPLDYDVSDQLGWHIFTLDGTGHRVDGTPPRTLAALAINSSLAMDEDAANRSFGLYRMGIQPQCAEVTVPHGMMMPYSFTHTRATVTVNPLCLLVDALTTLRIVAPYGFVWDFDPTEFIFHAEASGGLPGTTADLPGGVPQSDGNVLLWEQPAQYEQFRNYGFQALARIPDKSPADSANAFLIEFGYGETMIVGRIAAAIVNAGQVRALVNAGVSYATNVENKPNSLTFSVQTVTHIPSGGGLVINAAGVDLAIAAACSLGPAPAERGSQYSRLSSAEMLPPDVVCTSRPVTSDTDVQGVEIRVAAGPAGIPPRHYRFELNVTNPAATVQRTSISTACGFTLCWSFESVQDVSIGATPVYLDSPISIPGFALNMKMVEALMMYSSLASESDQPQLTAAQQAATGRDDRPLHPNPLIFAFQLNRVARNAGTMLLQGPLGVVFSEDCLEGIETRRIAVFGQNLAFPAGYNALPIDVAISGCRGDGPDAHIYIDPGDSPTGLRADVLYAFRIALLHNPDENPESNYWTIDYNGESSDPFPGFPLGTFTRTSLHTVSHAVRVRGSNVDTLWNPVTITFRPHTSIMGTGMKINITAPEGFEIAHNAYECRLHMQPIGTDEYVFQNKFATGTPEPNFDGAPGLLWGDADVECIVDPGLRKMTANVLASAREMRNDRDYQVTIFVHNPIAPMVTPSVPLAVEERNVWLIETDESPVQSGVIPTFRDLIRIPGFTVYGRIRAWLYVNEDAVTREPFRDGMTDVPGLYFQMEFPDKLEINDVVTIEAPSGFHYLVLSEGGTPDCGSHCCQGFRWEPESASNDYLPSSNISCIGNFMRFEVRDNVPERRLIKFRVDVRNPAKTPHVMRNHWVCTHRALGDAILSTGAILGWEIKPQLEDVQVLLVGREKRESSYSSITVSFVPVSDADVLVFEARRPLGFDFTGSLTASLGHEVIQTSTEVIRVRAALYAGVTTTVVIEGLRLGSLGGPTLFDLVTRLSNGELKDEALDFAGGFRLPGRLEVTSKRIYSTYNLDGPQASEYPVTLLWDDPHFLPGGYDPQVGQVRMGEEAIAKFHFTITKTANPLDMIRVHASPYILNSQDFQILKLGTIVPVATPDAVISTESGVLVARLCELCNLQVNEVYELRVNVITPYMANPEDVMWSFEVWDDDGTLPLNTNDGLTESFRLVDTMHLSMQVRRSPPLAEVDAEIVIDPRSTRPTEFLIVAPLGFNFTDDCLVQGGTNGVITACERGADIAGRASARLTAQEGGLQGPTELVQIKIITPSTNALEPSWFIDGRDSASQMQLGWGESDTGVPVRQMVGAKVVYPGIPGVSGQMAFQFTTNEKVNAGGKLQIGYPRSITINCDGAFLHRVALQGNIRCNNFPRQGYFELELERPLPPGQQAFMVTSTAPSRVEWASNFFYIVVLTPENQVVDAAMSVPGMPIQHGLRVASLELVWSTAEPNRGASVSLGFELLEELPDENPPIMSELVVDIPRDFTQQVRRTSHIEVFNSPLPWRAGTWLDRSQPRRLNFWLDEARTETLAVGRYRFSFPVLVPSRMPAYNVFTLTICGPPTSGSTTTCTGEDDPRALVVFPLPGFEMGQSHPSALQFTVTAACWRCRTVAAWLAALASLVLPRP